MENNKDDIQLFLGDTLIGCASPASIEVSKPQTIGELNYDPLNGNLEGVLKTQYLDQYTSSDVSYRMDEQQARELSQILSDAADTKQDLEIELGGNPLTAKVFRTETGYRLFFLPEDGKS